MLRIVRDFRHACRQLQKSPVFALVAILTIAFGIGANTAIFSVMNAVLLHFLPVPAPQQLVYFHLRNQPMHTSSTGYSDMPLSMQVFEAMRTQHDAFQDVIAFVPLAFDKVAVRVGSEPEEAHGEMVSGNFFSGLQIRPFLGRGFTPLDESAHAPVAVLNYAWWKTRFAGSKQILGQTIYAKGVPLTIVGVAPPGFHGVDPERSSMDFWIPLQQRSELNAWGAATTEGTLYGSSDWLVLMLLGRLQPGVAAQQAEARITPAFQSALAGSAAPSPNEQKPQVVLTALRGMESLRRNYEHPLRFLMWMVTVVLVIACGNVILLILARNAGRLSEFCLRQALGANKRALFSQLFLESAVLVAAGAALGWFLAGAITQGLTSWSGTQILIEPDQRVLLFTGGISFVVILAFALAPMPLITRLPLNLALRSAGGTASGERHQLWGRQLVVALQISLCVVLLSAAGLLYRSLRNLETTDLGMRTAGLLVFGISPEANISSDADAVRFHTALLERMRAVPGVDSATLTEIRFGEGGSDNNAVLVDGHNPIPERRFAPLRTNCVGSQFLHTFGIALYAGRDFADSDTASSAKVAIVNQTFVDQYMHGFSPLGHHISVMGEPTQYAIVGVAGNIRYTAVRETDRPMAYVPFSQAPGVLSMQYALHTSGNPMALLPEAATLVHDVDPNLPLHKPITQRDQFAESVSQERLVANLSIFFGLLAGFLVAIGLYGSISYGVSRRTMEIGVRMALGAQRREVLLMIFRESLAIAALGLAIGIPVAFAVGKTLQSMLYGLHFTDPLSMSLALLGIASVTLTAAFFPAYRASSIDPMRALRME